MLWGPALCPRCVPCFFFPSVFLCSSLPFPLRAPSLSFCCRPSPAPTRPSPRFVDARLHGKRFHTSYHHPAGVCSSWSNPWNSHPAPPPPTQPFLPFTAPIWCVRHQVGPLQKSGRSPRKLWLFRTTLHGFERWTCGGTDTLPAPHPRRTNAPLWRAMGLASLVATTRLAPPLLSQFPFPFFWIPARLCLSSLTNYPCLSLFIWVQSCVLDSVGWVLGESFRHLPLN